MPRSHRPSLLVRRTAALLLLAACAPRGGAAPAPRSPALAAPTAADRAWVERTLASLTLRDKVAQMVMPWVGGEYAAADSPEFDSIARWVERDRVGGLILSIGLPHSYAAKLNEAQRRSRVPLLVAADMENGPGMRLAGVWSSRTSSRRGAAPSSRPPWRWGPPAPTRWPMQPGACWRPRRARWAST